MICDLYLGDCLEKMAHIPDRSIDLVLCDLPYGTTENSWDTIIPLDDLWKQYKRVIKDKAAVVLFAKDMFAAQLMLSNAKWFRCKWIWDKVTGSGFQRVKYRPMQRHEEILVFGKTGVNYYPQMILRNKPVHAKGPIKASRSNPSTITYNDKIYTHRHPESILVFKTVKISKEKRYHSTQKPVDLLEYLIETYSREGDTVLDNCMGSGSTGIAAAHKNRHFIGIEKDPEIYTIASQRLADCLGDNASIINHL